MRWTIALLALFALSFAAGCGGEPPAPPKGSEDSATTLDVESGDSKEGDAPKEESPKSETAPTPSEDKPAEDKPAEGAKGE